MNTYLYKLKTSVVLCLLIGLGPSIYSQNKDKSEILKNTINFVELCRILWKSTKTCEEIWVVCKLKSNI